MSQESFFPELKENISNATEIAILRTVVSDPERSMGDIIDALSQSKELEYLLDHFRKLTINDIVSGSAALIRMAERAEAVDAVEVEKKEEPKKGDSKGGRSNGEIGKKVTKKSRKKSPTNRSDSKGEDRIDLSTPELQKQYHAQITKFLRKQKEPQRSTLIRAAVGGAPDQLRRALNDLIESKVVGFEGKARGTKYSMR
jgi:hypothetical protein